MLSWTSLKNFQKLNLSNKGLTKSSNTQESWCVGSLQASAWGFMTTQSSTLPPVINLAGQSQVTPLLFRVSVDSVETGEDNGCNSSSANDVLQDIQVSRVRQGRARDDRHDKGVCDQSGKRHLPMGKRDMWRKRLIAWAICDEGDDWHGGHLYLWRLVWD